MSEETKQKKANVIKSGWTGLEKKIQEHRELRLRLLWIILLICAAIIALVILYRNVAVFKNYRSVISIEKNDNEAIHYAIFGNLIIRYDNEGASCVDAENETIWTQPYEMENPIIVMRDSYVAIGDQKGKTIYIMDQTGYRQKIDTDLPIQKIDISNQGNVAVLMQEENSISYLGLYSLSGKKTAEGTLHFGNSGYPLALALSEDGENLALSVLDIKDGTAKSTVNFYNFSHLAEEGKDNQVASFSYENTLIPSLCYGANGRLVAFGDNKVICFRGVKEPQETNVIELAQTVRSVVHNADQFGLLYDQGEEAGDGLLVLYDYSGDAKRNIAIDGQYEELGFLNNGEIYLIQDKKLAIYRKGGRAKFIGTADTPYYAVLSEGRGIRYIFIREGKTEEVRLSAF